MKTRPIVWSLLLVMPLALAACNHNDTNGDTAQPGVGAAPPATTPPPANPGAAPTMPPASSASTLPPPGGTMPSSAPPGAPARSSTAGMH